MRIRLDRTLCDGFGICERHAPEHFSLDEWGYAALRSDAVSETATQHVTRAVLDCPVHAISFLGADPPEQQQPDAPTHQPDNVPSKESQ